MPDEMTELFPFTDESDAGDFYETEGVGTRALAFKYIGKALTANEFTKYVESYNFGSIPPDYIVVHHTARPYTIHAAMGPTTGAWEAGEAGLNEEQIKKKRLRQVEGMKNYYAREMGWERGPHLFIDDRYIYLFTPMYEIGIHASQGNSYRDAQGHLHYSIGIEVIGYYERVQWPEQTARLVGHAIAVLKRKLGT
ncbi:MAG: N-acetylmuramoyl-L-alanine amidase, partial [Ardenticatenaceae bacterium]